MIFESGTNTIRTIDNEEMCVDAEMLYSVEDTSFHYPHWGWLVVAILLFWPAAFVWLLLGVMRKKYKVSVSKNGFTYYVWLDKDNFNVLTSTAKLR